MLKDKIKKTLSIVALGALVVFAGVGVKSMMSPSASQGITEIALDDYRGYYLETIDELLNAGYIDQAKADYFRKGVDSEDVQIEIDKTYEFYDIDELVKSGEYSAEVGELEKQLLEAEYSGDEALADSIYDKILDQLLKEGVISKEDLDTFGTEDMIKEMLDAGYIDQAKADAFTNGKDSLDVKGEIYKNYDLFSIDRLVKSGEYSEEVGALEKQLIEADYSGNDKLYDELYNKYLGQLKEENIKEMLDAGYIDQAKADYFRKGMNSEEVEKEFNKTYDLFRVDLLVKSGEYSAELGELEKQLIEAEYSGNEALADSIYKKYIEQMDKEGVK